MTSGLTHVPDRCEFDAEIREAIRGGAWVEVPAEIVRQFGTRARIPVQASFDGVPYRGSVVPMGGAHVLGVTKAIRESIGKSVGDTVHVLMERDEAPRKVDTPSDLAAALDADPEARAFFEALSYTHRREYVEWIVEAKRPETRDRRVRQALEMLARRQKTR
ncbi:MAG TPA: YdeI/OmpD-associated family protein [Anaerolineae bacterium]|nr:YdeI/OmpD-associated family protein [Anaerolineae bacterium]